MSEQGKTYAAFIESELKAERERRAALDSRGLALVTTSGSLTTLLAAIGAFVTGRAGFQLPSASIWPLLLTLITLAAAAGCGLLASHNRPYRVADRGTLSAMTGARWSTHEVDARNAVASINAETVLTLRRGNNDKAYLLVAGLTSQLVGLLALGVAVGIILWNAT